MSQEGGYIGSQPQWNEYLRHGCWKLNDQFNRRKKNLWSVSQDPLANKVVLYLKADSLPIKDNQYISNEVTSIGNININQNIKKYGAASLAPTSSGSYVNIDHSSLAIGLDDFCWELWALSPNIPAGRLLDSNNILRIEIKSGAWLPFIGDAYTLNYKFAVYNNWEHIALTRQNNVFKFFVNGILITSITKTVNITSSILKVSNSFSGYLDSVRVTRGSPRYTVNFNCETDTFLSY